MWLEWLLSKNTQRDLTVSRSTFKRSTAWCWSVIPQAESTGEIHRWIMLDGTYYNGMCVLIAITEDHVIDWQHCDREKTVAWEALLRKIPAPDIAIVDGQRGLIAAIENIWPDTKIQRCYFHIQLTGTKYLTRRPVLEANKTLRALYTSLTDVDSLAAATTWLTAFHAWYQQYQDFLKHRSYLANTRPDQRPKRLRAGQKSWFTHQRTRSAYFALKRLVTHDQLFIWLTERDHPDESLPRATSRLEGGHNQPIKELFRNHRGMSESHATVAISWLLYMRTETAQQPWKLVTLDHWATTRKHRIISTTDDTGTPALFDTHFSWEDGNGIQRGWAGRSH